MFPTIRKILSPIRHIKKEFALNMVSELYDGFQSVFVIQVIASIIDAVLHHDIGRFYFWFWAFVLTAVVGILQFFASSIGFARAYQKLGYAISETYLGKFIRLDNNRVESLGTGRANSILIKGIDDWCILLLENFADLCVNILAITYAFAVIWISAGFTYFIVTATIFACMMLLSYRGMSKTLEKRDVRKDMQTEFDRSTIRIIMSKFEVLQNDRFRRESSRLKKLSDAIMSIWTKEEVHNSSYQAIVALFSAAMRGGIFFIVGIGVIRGTYTLGFFVLMNGLLQVINDYIWGIRRVMRTLSINSVGVRKLLDTFDRIPEIPGLENPKIFEFKHGDIRISDLGFGYLEDSLFKGLNLEIAGGRKTAFVGDSGSGKTTLMKLISGYLRPKSGSIIVDGQDLSEVNLISYYKHLGYLTQEPSVFDGTIRENLLYAIDTEPTEERIAKAIEDSKCGFIYDLRDSLDTEIGEKGVKLSGGQRQRLAIAKIMLKNPDIILLDEPTSALDSISEQAVSEALHNLFRGKTVIVIAHRLQTVKEADEILVFKNGQIIERGSHDALSGKDDGDYKKMLDLQTSF